MSLTEAQRELLSAIINGQILVHSVLTGNIWLKDRGFTMKVHHATFNALALRNLIVSSATAKSDTFYSITDAGRAALQKDEGK